MSASHKTDLTKLPVPSKGGGNTDIVHQNAEWGTDARGGGKVPPDFSWGSNPKQRQEERGSSVEGPAPRSPSP